MLFVDLLGWWYSRGWGWLMHQIFHVELAQVLRFFSVGDLLKTLFSPFRQDAIETRNAPIGMKLQALGGNIISRFFGLIIRSVLIIVGLLTALLIVISGIILLVLWPLIPLGPVVSLLLMLLEVGV